MPRILLMLLFLFPIQLNSYAQQNIDEQSRAIPAVHCVSIDSLSSFIRLNFNSDTARVRAIYTWITHHISYDVARFLAMDKGPGIPAPTAAEVLSARKAVCQGYAELFVTLCNGAGIAALRIPGYTKQQGKVSTRSHAWAAASLEGQWYLFDPTWGAGYVRNDVFVRRFNNGFYKVLPATFIADHMPFDPLLQMLTHPLTNKEFMDGVPPANTIMFKYNDSLKVHNKLSFVSQTAAELRRLEAAGWQHHLLQERRTYLKQILQSSVSKDAFEESGKAFKNAFALYKEFMVFKRAQFTTIADHDLKQKIDSIEFYVKKSRSLVHEAVPKTDAQRDAKAGQTGSIDRFWVEMIKQKDFTVKYLATDKEKRKQLFLRN